MIYVALLRGINVGGNNKINMKELKITFEQAGMGSVVTYIQSGNIIFADSAHSSAELAALLEQAIEDDFGLRIRVLLRSLPKMQAIVSALPEHWSNDEAMKSDCLFLWEEADNPDVLKQLPLKPGIGTVMYVPGAVLASFSREEAARSGMNKLIGSKVYQHMTVRNVNTTRRIYELMIAAEE